ncbi:hypothetical protein AVEN_11004-1 [Araneus ventricosus]|uniref:Uncharacterized protein n=1 Tax=Araneus ventricosus TaxID=182803 RepID=A0A4Y2RTD3_ARAVE|nr:hypothetical protein AVEN_6839-1 [Araneus ventricosus]GBN79018.1 hypothetical protein AVEN_11004-1 [Araneus ventricosus]
MVRCHSIPFLADPFSQIIHYRSTTRKSIHYQTLRSPTTPSHTSSMNQTPKVPLTPPHRHAPTPVAFMTRQSKLTDGLQDGLYIQLSAPRNANSPRFFL